MTAAEFETARTLMRKGIKVFGGFHRPLKSGGEEYVIGRLMDIWTILNADGDSSVYWGIDVQDDRYRIHISETDLVLAEK